MPEVIEMPIEEFSGVPQNNNEEIKRLRSRNSLWTAFSKRWAFYLAAYEGGEDFANRENLFKHVRETEEDFKDRAQRIHNLNYCEPLVDFFTNFIFSEPIDRSGGSNNDFFLKFIKDVNKKGDTVDDFMRQVCDDAQIFGMSYILVDAPAVESTETVTKADEEQLGIRPYWVLIKPEEIIDWAVDEFNKFLYVKRKQVVSQLVGREVRAIERYTEFYPDEIVVSDIDVTKETKPVYLGKKVYKNSLGKIPIAVARYKRSKKHPFMGLSFLRDFAGNNREIVNLTSLLQEFLYRQAFNILAKEVETGIPLAEQEEGAAGTSNVLEVPKGATFPKYISPPVDPAEFLAKERATIKQEMFLRAAQDAINELFNGEKASGFSQAQSFSKTVPFISTRADMLEGVEDELMQLTMERIGKKWDGKIKYKDRYELTNLSDALTQLQIICRDFQLPSETFVKSELKRMVREYDGKLPAETLSKIEKEIDQMNFEKWMDVQKQALVGRGSSPSEQQKPKSTGTIMEVTREGMQMQPNVAATKKPRGRGRRQQPSE